MVLGIGSLWCRGVTTPDLLPAYPLCLWTFPTHGSPSPPTVSSHSWRSLSPHQPPQTSPCSSLSHTGSLPTPGGPQSLEVSTSNCISVLVLGSMGPVKGDICHWGPRPYNEGVSSSQSIVPLAHSLWSTVLPLGLDVNVKSMAVPPAVPALVLLVLQVPHHAAHTQLLCGS